MKPKTLYILLAVLVVLIIINAFLTKESVKIQPFLENKLQQEAARQETPSRDYSYLLPSVSGSTVAITVIKKISLSKKTAPVAAEAQKKTEENNLYLEDLGESLTPSTTSVAEDNQYPTEEQKKEMKARNIVLY